MNRPPPANQPVLARADEGYLSVLLTQGVRLACKLAGIVVLARLVSPEEHGLFAMAASYTTLLALFRDLGTGLAAIQAPQLSAGQESALWRLHLLLGAVLAAATCAGAPLVAQFYGEPEVTPLLWLLSTGLVLNGLNSWPRTRLARELRFNFVNWNETAGAFAGTVAMIAAAALGAGAASFAWFVIVSELVMGLGAWRVGGWQPFAAADWAGLRGLIATGLNLTVSNVITHAHGMVDTIAMGRWFGSAALGPYSRAAQLLVQPATLIAVPFGQVLLATLSKLGPASPEFAPLLRRTANATAHLTLPLSAVCIALPEEIVRLVLGSGWEDATPLLRWLAVGSAAVLLSSTVQPLCVATGHSRRLGAMALVSLSVTLVALALGRSGGAAGLALALAAAGALLLIPRLWWATQGTPVRLADYGAALSGPLLQAAALGLGCWLGRQAALSGPVEGGMLRLGLSLTTGLAAYGLLAWVRRTTREELHHVLTLLPGLRRLLPFRAPDSHV